MKILVSGAGGLVGSALTPSLTDEKHQVLRLVRSPAQVPAQVMAGTARWNPIRGEMDPSELTGVEGVIHLAGENISSGRWTAAKKAAIRDSRVKGTRLLAETLTKLSPPPRVLVAASAIGFYGDRGEENLHEGSPVGEGFLPEVCQAWEAATQPAKDSGVRVVHLRFGVILSPAGGALAKMLFPFRMGVGGKLGAGDQYMSWITLDDAVGAIYHALTNPTLQGPVNVVAPTPVTNSQFTKTLGRVLSRPTLFPLPAPAARLAFGEMADALLLASTRVAPIRLEESGYRFRYRELEPALRHLLGRGESN
jgi:uncharacterized protein (TIGR01777 family)